MSAGHTEGEFVREERFIVIKRKQVSAQNEAALRNWLTIMSIPTVECVVVESDWPEYETVWKMIEARVTGRAIEAAEADLLGRCLEALRTIVTYAPDIGVDQFLDGLSDARRILSQAREVK